MNERHEIEHASVPQAKARVTISFKDPVKAKDFSDGRECRPTKTSGWRPARGFNPRMLESLPMSVSAWIRRDVFILSAFELAEAPDGTGEAIPQWHVSISTRNDKGDHPSKRSSDEEVRQTLAGFGMTGAEEDNHHPGVARHFWMPVDPARRRDCECKVTEKVITEPDGYRYSEKIVTCAGCELEVAMNARGIAKPCERHQRDLIVGPNGDVLASDVRAALVRGTTPAPWNDPRTRPTPDQILEDIELIHVDRLRSDK